MILTLLRLDPFGEAQHGDLFTDGTHLAVTLENLAHAIPAGRYPLVLTESARCKAGGLWSPREDHVLPLLCDVTDRTGIRVHAANQPSQLEGCIAPGTARDGETITGSRVALIALMARLQAAIDRGEDVVLDVIDP